MDFLKEADHDVWSSVYGLYTTVLKLKAKTMKPEKSKQLQQLDHWYQNDLPQSIQSRKEKFITHEELCKLMKWKLTRGKFRPRLEQLVQTNLEKDVEEVSKKAFKKLPNLSAAIQELTILKAIGPATASAVLAAGAPEQAGFMADESMLPLPGMQPISYTLGFYLKYMDEVKTLVKRLNKAGNDWTPHKVEITLWTYQLAKNLQPDLLQNLSGSKRCAEEKEGTTKRKKIKT